MSGKDERYRIGPGDVLEVLVYNHPQLSRPALRVDGRGMIRMPLLEGEIQAACKTESDLAVELSNRYQKYQNYPQVDVYVKEFNSQPVAVVGAVNSPGRFQLQRRVRLLELLTFAGGPSALAGRSIQIVHGSGAPRICGSEAVAVSEEDEELTLTFYSLKDTMRGDQAANPFLTPGDVITIPDAEQIFVVGNVPRPSAFPLKEPLTVSRAIVMAGGALPQSEQGKIRIVRQGATSNAIKTEIIVSLKDINKGKAEDIVLLPNDVVEVPREGGVKTIIRGLVNTIVPTLGSLPMRVIY